MNDTTPPVGPDMDMRTPPPLKVLKIGIIGFFALAVLSAVYAGGWYWVASEVEASIDRWRDLQHARGLDIQFEKRLRRGFPGTVEFQMTAPSITQPGERGWSWSAEQLTLSAKPWAFHHILFDFKGTHRGSYVTRSGEHGWEGAAQKWQGSFELETGRISQVQSLFGGLTLRGMTNDPNDNELQMAGGEVSVAGLQNSDPEFIVRGRDLVLPSSLKAPLGNQVAHFDARGTVTGFLRPGPLTEVLKEWRDGGGVLELSNLDLDYQPLRVRGKGTLALDAALQPIGAFSVKAEGFFATVDALHQQGFIPLGTSFATKIALGVLSKTPDGGGTPYLDLPITLQDQTLFAGSIALLKIQPVRW